MIMKLSLVLKNMLKNQWI